MHLYIAEWWPQLHELTHPSCRIITIFLVCGENIFKSYSLSKSQVYKAVLLAIITMLYIRSPELVNFTARSCIKNEQVHCSISPHTPHHPGNHQSIVFIWAWLFKIPYVSEITQYLSFSLWVISLSTVSSKSIEVVANGSYTRRHHIPSYWQKENTPK